MKQKAVSTMLPSELPSNPGIYTLFFVHAPELCYIGSTINLRQRFSQHCSDLRKQKHANRHLQFAFNKYGQDALCCEVVEQVERKEDLIVREQYFLDTLKPYYNILSLARNCLGSVRTPEHRAKLSAAHMGKTAWNKGKSLSPEIIAKLSAAHMGQTSWNKGKSPSPESIAKMKESLKGKLAWNKGMTIPPDELEQINAKKRATRVAKGGYVSHNKGKTVPPEMRKRISVTLLNKSPEEKAQMLEKQMARLAERTPEQETQRHEKRKATIAARYTDEEMNEILHAAQVNRPPEAKAQSLEKFSATLAARTPEQWEVINARRRAGFAKRTPEQRAQSREKQQATKAANKARKLKEGQLSLQDDNTLPT